MSEAKIDAAYPSRTGLYKDLRLISLTRRTMTMMMTMTMTIIVVTRNK